MEISGDGGQQLTEKCSKEQEIAKYKETSTSIRSKLNVTVDLRQHKPMGKLTHFLHSMYSYIKTQFRSKSRPLDSFSLPPPLLTLWLVWLSPHSSLQSHLSIKTFQHRTYQESVYFCPIIKEEKPSVKMVSLVYAINGQSQSRLHPKSFKWIIKS